MRRVLTVLLAVLMVSSLLAPAAMAAPGATPASSAAESIEPVTSADTTSDASGPDEPIGCWEGTCHDDELDIDQSDGLTDEELEQLVHLKMARVEYLRDRKFQSEVPVETMTREEYTEMVESRESDSEFNRWNDQVWKGLFIVGEDSSSEEEINTAFSGAVAGFYSPAQDRIVIVVPEGEELRISPTTLLHELGHAMQDQYHDLTQPQFRGATQDADLAVDGIVEGEVVYLENRYEERCGTEWQCTDEPEAGGSGGGASDLNFGIFLTVFQPYSDGAAYVADIIEEEGWEGVEARMESPPQASSQVIHRDDDRELATIEFEDTAENGWETYPDQGVDGADTVGEASMFAMFWYQSREYDADTFDWQQVLTDTEHPDEVYNYVHESTDGWAGDELYPYRNDAGDEERDGYVWVTEWQSPTDAEQFHETYLRMLEAHNVVHREDGVHHVEDGPFRGAYGIERDGTTVTIAHGPEPADVFDLRPGIALDEPEPTTEPTEERTAAADTPTETTPEPTVDDSPGFGVVVTLVALVAASMAARVVRRQ